MGGSFGDNANMDDVFLMREKSQILKRYNIIAVFQVKNTGVAVVPVHKADQPSLWMCYIRPARDCHEQNVEISQDWGNRPIMKAIKDIVAGAQLLVWYSQSMALSVGILPLGLGSFKGAGFDDVNNKVSFCSLVFVTLFTSISVKVCRIYKMIRHLLLFVFRVLCLSDLMTFALFSGEKYICQLCGKTYSYPNPLKAHLRFRCLRNSNSNKNDVSVRSTHTEFDRNRTSTSLTFSPSKSKEIPAYSSLFQTFQSKFQRYGGQDTSYGLQRKPKVQVLPEEHRMHTIIGAGVKTRFISDQHMRYTIGVTPMRSTANMPPSVSKLFNTGNICGTNHSNSRRALDITPSKDNSNQARSVGEVATDDNKTCTKANTEEDWSLSKISEKNMEPIDLLPSSVYVCKDTKNHLCIYCGKIYSRKYGLKIHLRTHTGYKPLNCKVCQRPFGDPSNLNKHIRLHSDGETPYRCQHCGKVLVRRRDLERHVKSRHTKLCQESNCKRN